MRAAVLVPVKRFTQAKARLVGVLDPAQRAALARTMATIVVRAARPLPVHVVCDDVDVARWAADEGASVIWRPGYGLNGAVTSSVGALGAAGVARVVVAHGDLPLATSFVDAARDPGVTLVPDRRDDGTNVLCVEPGRGFQFAYGAGSFRRHEAEAHRIGSTVRVIRDPQLSFDVDGPDDLSMVAGWIFPASHR